MSEPERSLRVRSVFVWVESAREEHRPLAVLQAIELGGSIRTAALARHFDNEPGVVHANVEGALVERPIGQPIAIKIADTVAQREALSVL